MALATGATIAAYSGWEEITDGTNALVADDGWSIQTDLPTTPEWTNSTNAEMAAFRLEGTWTATPDANGPTHLYARLIEIDGTNDEPQVDATYQKHYLGTFIGDAVATAQYLGLVDAPLPSATTSQKIEFYIHNAAGSQLNANWRIYINPKGHTTVL